jgi:hypothetical protein
VCAILDLLPLEEQADIFGYLDRAFQVATAVLFPA